MTTLAELVADILDDGDWLTANELFKELPDSARDLVGDATALHTFLCGKPDWFVWKDKIGVWTLTRRQPGRTHLRLTAPSITAVTLDTEPTEPRDAVPAAEEPAKGAVRTPAPVRPTPTRPPSRKATPVPIRVTPRRPKPRAASKAEAGSEVASVPSPNRGSTPARPVKAQAVAGTDPASTLERALRERLRGRRIVAEIGLGAALHEEVEATLELVLAKRLTGNPIETLPMRYPALLVTYLVGHGVYHYTAGDFWGKVNVRGVDQHMGAAFTRALGVLNLETFEDLVVGDGAARYVGPILAHGGIPKYCLVDFFTLLLRDLGKVDGDAREVLSFWRTRKTTFAGVDQPVRRFLLYGGDLAIDYLDRCIDMLRAYSVHQRVGTPAEVGLPPYVIATFRNLENKQIERARTGRVRRVPRPSIRIDPWAPFGPELELPQVPFDLAGATWRMVAGSDARRVPASAHEGRVLTLAPATAWSVELSSGNRVEHEVIFEGFDTLPALFFDPTDGQLLAPGSGFRADSLWILAPDGVEVGGVTATGLLTELDELDELPDLSGDWSGFRIRHVSLDGIRSLRLPPNEQSRVERRITVRPPAERPTLEGDPLESVSTDDGLPVHAALPTLRLPVGDFDESQWVVKVAVNGSWTTTEAGLLPEVGDGRGLQDLVPEDEPCIVGLVVQGPLGADLRTTFAFAPGLEVEKPDRLLFPDDPAGDVTVSSRLLSLNDAAPGQRVVLDVPPHDDEVAVTAAQNGAHLRLVVQIEKLMWGIVDQSAQATDLTNEVDVINAGDVLNGDAVAVAVRTRSSHLPLELALVNDGVVLQRSDRVKTAGGEGRWSFDLGRFASTIGTTEVSRLTLVLRAGVRPVTVATIRPSWKIRNLHAFSRVIQEFTSVDVTFDEERPLTNRVLRLWSADRPWEQPLVEQIPDGTTDAVSISGYNRIPPGHYLVELAVDDGWGSQVRPAVTATNVVAVTVGSPEQARHRLSTLPIEDPFAVLEIAVATSVIRRELGDDELKQVASAALSAALVLLGSPIDEWSTSRHLGAALSMLCANPEYLAAAVVDAAESGLVEPYELNRLAIALASRMRVALHGDDGERVARSLWAVAPMLAAQLDIRRMCLGFGEDRAREFLGWDPSKPISEVFVGEAVDQNWIGKDGDQLRSIRRNVDLMPKRLLASDALVLANFEWLLALKEDGGPVEDWWARSHRIADKVFRNNETVNAFLDAREPPRGTSAIAGLPKVTLAAALLLVWDAPGREEAMRALARAAEFAPRLVARDLVLARLLVFNQLLRSEPT